ncbi:MAG: DUF6512 family protein [bacterium]
MNIFIKSILYLIVFSLLHFGYDWTQWVFLKPFCGINESVFQHLKMAFWAYFITTIIEYFIINKKNNNFWFPRFFSVTIIPWIIFLIWYLAPALIGKFPLSVYELVWALFVTYLSGIIAGIVEKNLEQYEFTIYFRTIIFVLLLISALLYICFTYQLPWVDVFNDPELL